MDTCYTVKKCWQGEETPGVITCKHDQRIIVVHRCQPTCVGDSSVRTQGRRPVISFMVRVKHKKNTKRYENLEEKEKHVKVITSEH